LTYHHGDLREALLVAASTLARTGGPDAVGLRAVTRAAEVSHNAAYRHFADRDDLLLAVSERCMERLADLIARRLSEVEAGPDPGRDAWNRLYAAGYAYVEFALAEPGWFRTAFAAPPPGRLPDLGAPLTDARPYRLLSEAIDGLVAAGVLPASRRPGAEFPAWAAVHGIATLLVDGPLRLLDGDVRDQVVAKVVTAVGTGL
jgi:AcrR family transcriptional regulator